MRFFTPLVFAALLAAVVPPAHARPVAAGYGYFPARVPASAVTPERLEAISRTYLGTPYRLDCLGEGGGPDADPLFTRKAVDCQTFVEQVVAEAVAPWTGGMDRAVRLIRYHRGEVRLEDRYHYCIPDWLENPWPIMDITARVAGREGRRVDRRIDLPQFLASRGGNPALSPAPAATVHEAYIPRDRVPSLARRIPNGSLAVFVLGKPGIVSGHLGFLFREKGVLQLRHASQTRKKVIQEPLLAYLARAPRKFIGVKVLQPDVSGLQR